MLSAFALHEHRQCAFLGTLVGLFLLLFLAIHHAPSFVEDGLSRHLEFHLLHLSQYCGSCKLTVGIEGSDKASCYEVIHISLDVGKIRCRHSRRDDGMVVGHLR